MEQALLLLAHGSRNEQAREQYKRLAEAVAARLPEVPVGFSVLEFPGDGLASIGEGVARQARRGARRLVALPYFLFTAGHVREDLAGELAEAAKEFPDLELAYQPPLGVDPALLDALEARAAEGEAGLEPVDGQTALLLVGAGTSDPDANADLYRAARLLWERKCYPLVEVAFVSLTEPKVAAAIDRCVALGAARVLISPYFLNTGVLSRRIDAAAEAARSRHPDLQIGVGAEIGLHQRLLDLLVERAWAGLASPRSGLALPACAVPGQPWACWLDPEYEARGAARS
jgi:sirohydrochlorin cobaltochelatase